MINHLPNPLNANDPQSEPQLHSPRCRPRELHAVVPKVWNILIFNRHTIAEIISFIRKASHQVRFVLHQEKTAAVGLEEPFVSIPRHAVGVLESIDCLVACRG
ncbi:hypothetical protein FOXG_20224 [Fusarium oxysporum f. sp. lycopersici 4287]|uniref:Uncharacterized protein n=1 Tax=Fusarium oxysporum f. sp. lycopersici (strain 4287 / CBS 123668 / FGSC 9935 / NRRL 34936) TaxID=426428 RepID=A0A0J9VDU2_FUSO4|nr:hypothetical protein FOXG_20224 [Fusarium oxysporum f. sp. lycopersici 4287]KNB09549.1 hypothetical protein FOXG_20224 [Fusarium oxysporum f. sp. lycopersici 4287]